MQTKLYPNYTGILPVFAGYRCPPNHASWLEWFVNQDKEIGIVMFEDAGYGIPSQLVYPTASSSSVYCLPCFVEAYIILIRAVAKINRMLWK